MIRSANRLGSSPARRQPRSPPSKARAPAGLGDGGLLEVRPGPQVLDDPPGLLGRRLDRRGVAHVLHGEQDVPHPKLVGKQLLVVGGVEQVVHVLLADGDAPVHHVALQALNQHLPADVLPKRAVAHAVFRQRLLELLQGHVVLLGEAGDGAGQGFVVDLDAAAPRLLDLNVLQHQPLHQLADQDVVGRHLHTFAVDLLAHDLKPAEQLRSQHHVVIHNGDYGVQLLVLGVRRNAGKRREPSRQPAAQDGSRGSLASALALLHQ